MAEELEDKLTPVTREELVYGFWSAWVNEFGDIPKKESIWILVAHTILECGLKYVHNYNLGNVKSREGDGYDYQYFKCGEELLATAAKKEAAVDPRVKIVKEYASGAMASVTIAPKHPWCRFRAFRTLEDGVLDHLLTVYKRFQAAWPAVQAGDPKAYAHALKQQRYYTADERQYTRTLTRCLAPLAALPIDYDSLSAPGRFLPP